MFVLCIELNDQILINHNFIGLYFMLSVAICSTACQNYVGPYGQHTDACAFIESLFSVEQSHGWLVALGGPKRWRHGCHLLELGSIENQRTTNAYSSSRKRVYYDRVAKLPFCNVDTRLGWPMSWKVGIAIISFVELERCHPISQSS